MNSLIMLPYVFIGGGFGATLRWFLGSYVVSMSMPIWYSTAIVNILGTGLYCLSYKLLSQGDYVGHHLLRVGILGSFTTFSTFSYEMAFAFKRGDYQTAAMVFLLNVLAGVLVAIGIFR